MDSNETLTQAQKEALKETLERAGAFEEMATTKGWQYVVAYYQNQIALFMNEIMGSDKPIEEFEEKRHELMGLKKLLGQIDSAIQTLNATREKEAQSVQPS
jgi:hypothetical protein